MFDEPLVSFRFFFPVHAVTLRTSFACLFAIVLFSSTIRSSGGQQQPFPFEPLNLFHVHRTHCAYLHTTRFDRFLNLSISFRTTYKRTHSNDNACFFIVVINYLTSLATYNKYCRQRKSSSLLMQKI